MKFLTVNQVREVLGNCSRSTVYRWVDEGRIPQPYRKGGRPLWDRDELVASVRDEAA